MSRLVPARNVLLCLGVLSLAASSCLAADDLQAILAGLRAREASIRTVSGQLLMRGYTGSTIQAQYAKEREYEGMTFEPQDVARALVGVDFWMTDGRLRLDVRAYRPGLSPWFCAGAPPRLGEDEPWWPASHLQRHLLDGERDWTYSSYDCVARARPQEAFLGPCQWPPVSRFLLFGPSSVTYSELLAYAMDDEPTNGDDDPPPGQVRVGRIGPVKRLHDPARPEISHQAISLAVEEEAGLKLHRVRITRQFAASVETIDLWIAPELGYAVTRALTTSSGQRGTGDTLVEGSGFAEVAPGVWLPGVTTHTASPRSDPDWVLTYTFKWSSLRVNEALADDVFSPAMPPGTLIEEPGAERAVGPVDTRAWRAFRGSAPDWEDLKARLRAFRVPVASEGTTKDE